MALTSELSLDAVLGRLTETAAKLTDARYAALGVIDPTGSHLERFITDGLDEAATQWSQQLESLNEMGNALATETDVPALLDLVSRRLRELLEARIVLVLLPEGDTLMRIAAAAGGGSALVGETLERSGSKS